jgi:hypothetical protein
MNETRPNLTFRRKFLRAIPAYLSVSDGIKPGAAAGSLSQRLPSVRIAHFP